MWLQSGDLFDMEIMVRDFPTMVEFRFCRFTTTDEGFNKKIIAEAWLNKVRYKFSIEALTKHAQIKEQ